MTIQMYTHVYRRYSGYQRSYSHSPSAAGIPASSPNDDHHHQYHSNTTNASHSTASTAATAAGSSAVNINSHKSLPDLHAQISRHSPHSEALSCCSRGARSNKSGSSFNRDSGGSSGHYTHRSDPNSSGQAVVCGPAAKYTTGSKQHSMSQQQQQTHQMISADPASNAPAIGSADFRRDSGSSTQHSGNSYYAYGIPPQRYDCIECRTKLPQTASDDSNCLLNFTTPEVPEAFQDDYQQQQHLQQHHQLQQQQNTATTAQMMMMMMVGGKPPSSSAAAARYSRDKDTGSHYTQQRQQAQAQQHRGYVSSVTYGEDTIDHSIIHQTQMLYFNKVHAQQPERSAPLEAELSPPLGTFKRQRCLRVKQRDRYSSPSDRTSRCGSGGGGNDNDSSIDRRPILRSKSDVSDRHWQHRNAVQQLDCGGGGGGLSPTMGNKLMDLPPPQATLRSHSSGSSGGGGAGRGGNGSGPVRSEVYTQLERFFDRLGLQEEVYDACIAPKRTAIFGSGSGCGGGGVVDSSGRSGDDSNDSDHSSPVFFSDASTVDSARIVDRAEAAAQEAAAAPPLTQQQQQMYRPSEPPSIVERNARIIKWLCACRKSQLA